MKIVHVCLSGSYNDNWGYQDNIIPKYNKKDGHNVTVITSIFIDSKKYVGYEKVDAGEYFLDDGVKVIRIPFKSFFISTLVEKLRIYKNLYKRLEEEKPDFIFMHGIQFWDMKTVIKYKKKNPNCILVADNHASFENSAQNIVSREILHKIIWKRIIQQSLPYIDKIFAITPRCWSFANAMYEIPDSKMEYLYLGADTEKINFEEKREMSKYIREQLDIKKDDFVLITGGKLSKGKNTELLLDSIKKINSDKLKLIIFGEFSEDIKKKILRKIEQDERVKYIGWLNSEDVYKYYLSADAAIFPGTKSALWEQAICSGLPLICKKWEGMDYVDVGGNCIFIDGDHAEQLTEKVLLLMGDKNLYKEMKQIAETKGYETFSYERISRQAIRIN